MKTDHVRGLVLLLLLFCVAIPAPAADEPPIDKGRMSAAIVNGLSVLAKEADAWTKKESCLACDQMPLALWAHGEALRRGFNVNRDQVDRWLAWAGPSTDAKAGPEALSFVVFASLRENGKIPPSMRPLAMTHLLLALQQPDGSWLPASRLTRDQRRPPEEAQEAVTRLAQRTFQILQIERVKAGQAEHRAWEWLRASKPPESTETLAIRLRCADYNSKEETAVSEQLLREQHADGGWAWRIGGTESDAYTTGMALHALNQHSWKAPAKAVARAQEWLLIHQDDDASWHVKSSLISTRDDPDQRAAEDHLYTICGTAWATLGLLAAFPGPIDGEGHDGMSYHRNGNLKNRMHIAEGPDGKKVYSMIEYYPHGSLKFEMPITEMPGELGFGPHGTVKTYHENGKIASIIQYNKAVLEGPFSLYYEDGSLRETGVFANGVSKTLERYTRSREKLDPAVRLAVETDKTSLKVTDEITVYVDSYEDGYLDSAGVDGYRWVDDEWKRVYQGYLDGSDNPRGTRSVTIKGQELGPGRWQFGSHASRRLDQPGDEVRSKTVEIVGDAASSVTPAPPPK